MPNKLRKEIRNRKGKKVWVLAKYYIGPFSHYSGSGNTDFARISIHRTKAKAIQKVIEVIDQLEELGQEDWEDWSEGEEKEEEKERERLQMEDFQQEKRKCIQELREQEFSWPVPYNNHTYMFHISQQTFE